MIFPGNIFKTKTFFLAVIFVFALSSLFYGLRPASAGTTPVVFEIRSGEGFFNIVKGLKSNNLIRSATAFEIYAALSGAARKMKPGIYELHPSMGAAEIIGYLSGPQREIEVAIPDGANVSEVDNILSEKKILPPGFLFSFAAKNDIEGKLYPDTYRFLQNSTPEAVVEKFLKNFSEKAEPILKKTPPDYKKNLILASLVQKEVSDERDARIISGILKKRLAAGMKLDIDATVCYVKRVEKNEKNCYPLQPEDFKIDSPYNTYLHSGLPPSPIGSPNASAINAVVNSLASPYWFYLSDPKTGKTIFSKTLEEQSEKRRIYLKSN